MLILPVTGNSMIEIVQTGQSGKTHLLFDMHRLRARVFKDRLKWNVNVDPNGLEVDQFDLPDTVYLLALDHQKRVIGNWRLLPSTGPTMIHDIWPQFLKSLPMPKDPYVFEVSRFAINSFQQTPKAAVDETQQVIAEMFCSLTELCIKTGIRQIYTLYDDRIAKVIRRIDCSPYKTSEKIEIDGIPCQTGVFNTDTHMLERLQRATGIRHSLLHGIEMPPALVQNPKLEAVHD